MARFDVVVVGDCNADLLVSGGDVVPAFGQAEQLVEAADLVIGGSGGIFAAGSARLGLRVAMVGVLGDDVFGRFMRESLGERGADMSAVRTDPRLPTGLSVNLIRDGDRAIITNPGTIPELRASDVDADLLADARHVHVSSYFLQSGLWEGLPGLLRRARKAGATVSLDPNWDPSEAWDHGLSGLYDLLDVVLPNEAEAAGLASAVQGPHTAGVRFTAAETAEILAAAGPDAVVKRGAEGALAALPGGELLRVPAIPGVRPVDSVGAGDSFDAGYLAARLWGWDQRRALEFGAACGALSTRRAGGTAAQPTKAEALEVIR